MRGDGREKEREREYCVLHCALEGCCCARTCICVYTCVGAGRGVIIMAATLRRARFRAGGYVYSCMYIYTVVVAVFCACRSYTLVLANFHHVGQRERDFGMHGVNLVCFREKSFFITLKGIIMESWKSVFDFLKNLEMKTCIVISCLRLLAIGSVYAQ